jgi:hypothetical protein
MKKALAFSMVVMAPLSLILCQFILPGFVTLMLIPAGASLLGLFALFAILGATGMLFQQYGQNGAIGIIL